MRLHQGSFCSSIIKINQKAQLAVLSMLAGASMYTRFRYAKPYMGNKLVFKPFCYKSLNVWRVSTQKSIISRLTCKKSFLPQILPISYQRTPYVLCYICEGNHPLWYTARQAKIYFSQKEKKKALSNILNKQIECLIKIVLSKQCSKI